MKLRDAPPCGEFLFEFNNRFIYIPSFLNNLAKYKSENFWIWLITDNPHDTHIRLTYNHIMKGP